VHDLANTFATITGRKAGSRSLGDAWAGTTRPHGRLMLTVLSGLAEFERDLIRARTSDSPRPHQGARRQAQPQTEIHRAPEARGDTPPDQDGEPVREIARSCNFSRSTISRLAA
jgi:DNA invertase Pin-like site-specific DNA recombinase